MEIALVSPRIPPNTGNVARLCAATSVPLNLVEPLGFEITDKNLKRAGLDYWPHVKLRLHNSLDDFLRESDFARLRFFSKKAERSYLEAKFRPDDCLVFGSETEGLPGWLHNAHPESFFRIPMIQPKVRSLNLSSAVAIVLYEALRQTGAI